MYFCPQQNKEREIIPGGPATERTGQYEPKTVFYETDTRIPFPVEVPAASCRRLATRKKDAGTGFLNK